MGANEEIGREEYVATLLFTEFLCPVCGGDLRSLHNHVDADGNVTPHGEQPLLVCTAGEHTYPIKNGVAVLLPPDMDAGAAETIATFAKKWQTDPTAMREERRRIANPWFMERFGFTYPGKLDNYLADHARILDAGCGLGNLTELFAKLAPHATVYGADLSPAVHYVQRAKNIKLVQCDITRLPVVDEFDLIVADGVLHHTESTRGAMLALFAQLAPGGDFLFYLYKRKAPIREFADGYLRLHIVEMPDEQAMEVCAAIADLGKQLRAVAGEIKITKPIPLLGIPAGTFDVQRFVYWFMLKCFYDDGGSSITSTLENYDWYKPRYAWRHTREEIEGWLRALPATYTINEVEAGFAVRVTKAW
jgi:SAM-dependent methyltransferase